MSLRQAVAFHVGNSVVEVRRQKEQDVCETGLRVCGRAPVSAGQAGENPQKDPLVRQETLDARLRSLDFILKATKRH